MRIVAAVDRSEVSKTVADMAARLARCEGGEVLLLHIAPREADLFGQQLTRKVITEPVPEDLQDRFELLQGLHQRLQQTGVRCETLLVRGDPARAVVREAKAWDADLLVMGSHGRGGLLKQFIGSVSEAVVSSRELPVLIIPSSEPPQ